MSTENNCTIRLLRPINRKVQRALLDWLKEHEFSFEWDDKFEPGEIEVALNAGEGVLMLHARNVAYEEPDKVIALAKRYGFSVVIHTEWTSIGDNDTTSNIVFYDMIDGRSGDIPATNDTRRPLVPLVEALALKPHKLRAKYCLPLGLDK